MRTEWHSKTDFADYAEALGINTEQIMAVQVNSSEPPLTGMVLYSPSVVMFTPDTQEELDPTSPVYCQVVARDKDGILRPVGPPRPMDFGWDEMRRAMEERIDELMRKSMGAE